MSKCENVKQCENRPSVFPVFTSFCNITHVGLPISKVHPTGVGNRRGKTFRSQPLTNCQNTTLQNFFNRQSANFVFLSSWNLNSSITAVRSVNSWHIMCQHMRYWYKNHVKRPHMERYVVSRSLNSLVVLNETNQLL